MDELELLLQRAKAALTQKDYEMVEALVRSYAYVTDLLEDKRTTIDRLRTLLFGSRSEKTRDVVGAEENPTGEASAAASTEPAAPASNADSPSEPAESPPGHGRHRAEDYEGAQRVEVPHGSLRPGDPCPECRTGTVYEQARPGVLVRIVGQAPVQATVYALQRLRCNLCGKVFTAEAPAGVGGQRYDATAASMIGLLKYGTGVPFNRLEGLQESLRIPLPASTQWEIVRDAARSIEPAHEELIRQAAQGQVLYNDDTTIKILELMGDRAGPAASGEDLPDRRGMFTSGIVSTHEGRRIALFFSGRRHAGENLARVLARRAEDLEPPIQMCDALSRNMPAELKTILANCMAHGRRQFVEVADRFPEACRYVLERLAEVYRNDAIARQREMSPEERLAFHQAESGPVMEALHAWLSRQFEGRLVEPNSALGQAISYLLKHWERLTLFLRNAGAPLDNNICERALKLAIRNRNNALFYRTLNGAHVGDLFMSLIHTCQLNNADPFDYLTELQRHAADLAAHPETWMPWNYRETLADGRPSPAAVS